MKKLTIMMLAFAGLALATEPTSDCYACHNGGAKLPEKGTRAPQEPVVIILDLKRGPEFPTVQFVERRYKLNPGVEAAIQNYVDSLCSRPEKKK